MSKIKFSDRTYAAKIYVCFLSFCFCPVLSQNSTRVQNATPTTPPASSHIPASNARSLKDSYEEYDAGDRDLLFDNFKTYEDDAVIEKGIRKLDTSIEAGAVVSVKNAQNSTAPSTSASPIDRKDIEDEEQSVLFEDSENREANISGTLVTKLIPEILKYNGRMVMPSSEELQRDPKTESLVKEGGGDSVIQKLSPRKIRQESPEEQNVRLHDAYHVRNFSKLEDIFDLYNPYRLNDVWEQNEELERLSPECRLQTETYLTALQRGQSWAIKSKSLIYLNLKTEEIP